MTRTGAADEFPALENRHGRGDRPRLLVDAGFAAAGRGIDSGGAAIIGDGRGSLFFLLIWHLRSLL